MVSRRIGPLQTMRHLTWLKLKLACHELSGSKVIALIKNGKLNDVYN